MLQAGVVWHLLMFLFNYDYTLDELATGIHADVATHETVSGCLSLHSHLQDAMLQASCDWSRSLEMV